MLSYCLILRLLRLYEAAYPHARARFRREARPCRAARGSGHGVMERAAEVQSRCRAPCGWRVALGWRAGPGGVCGSGRNQPRIEHVQNNIMCVCDASWYATDATRPHSTETREMLHTHIETYRHSPRARGRKQNSIQNGTKPAHGAGTRKRTLTTVSGTHLACGASYGTSQMMAAPYQSTSGGPTVFCSTCPGLGCGNDGAIGGSAILSKRRS